MFVYLKTPDVGTQGQNEGGRLVGGEVRVREGSEGSYIDFTDALHFARGEP